MKTFDEVKQELAALGTKAALDLLQAAEQCQESTYCQLSKALCGKENATICEVLDAVSQLKSRLAQAERERDAMHRDMKLYSRCKACKKFADGQDCPVHTECTYGGKALFEWRGVCPENTKEERP